MGVGLFDVKLSLFMNTIKTWFSDRLYILLILIFVIFFSVHISSLQEFNQQLKPQSIYSFTLDMSFDPDDEAINIETFIPHDSERQQVVTETVITNGLNYLVSEDEFGRIAQWSGVGQVNSVQYKALIASREVTYEISENLDIPATYPEGVSQYLEETSVVQVNHPEIKALWKMIQPSDPKKILAVLQVIYHYTYNKIEGAPFKGLTDAVTALRLQQASCNGKSRLFVALARLNNIPARLVGGIILNEGSKKTSHQWVEAYIEGHWVPFGVTNGNFARLPEHYLTLYRNDKVLFKHTSNINFDYLFSINYRLVAPSLYPVDLNQQITPETETETESMVNVSQLLQRMGLAPKTVGLFLLFPLCTLMITFLRNIIGIKTFGIFMPMLIGAACIFTGFTKGIIAFTVILAVSYLSQMVLDKMRMLKVARLAAIITINTSFFIIGLSLIGTSSNIEFGMLSLFPVVIISFIAEKIHNMTSEDDWLSLVLVSLGTLISIWLCYLILDSFLLEGIFSFYPEFYLLVLAAQIYIGQWTGLRISELHRFRGIIGDENNPVLGINGRNRNLVYGLNDKKLLRVAADKLKSKQLIQEIGGVVPETLFSLDSLAQLNSLDKFLDNVSQFALKPNHGSQGNGILIIVAKEKGKFISASGKELDYSMIKKHCSDIIAGSFSQIGDDDKAYFEPLLIQHESLQKIAPYGLSDVRVILAQGKVVSAMLRLPTKRSDGKANLHQGAVGVAIDVNTGITINARLKQKTVTEHPDNKVNLLGFQLPYWDQIIQISKKCQTAIPLGYMGVDICIDQELGALVLEVNGRPGIEIQNIHNRGLYGEYQ